MFTIIQAGASCKWTSDSQRFLLEHFDMICQCPSHIYHSALPFCPSSSWLHKCYSAKLSEEVKVIKGLPAGWGKCSRTVSLDRYTPSLSYLNNTIAAGSVGGDIIILDAITGGQLSVLSGHTDRVMSVAFSSDGRSLVSGSFDKTVKLWDVQTGGIVKTFHGHTTWVWTVSISADCTRIASGSQDGIINLWDIQTGVCHCVIEQQKPARYISFSPTNPQHLLSINDSKIWQWDINGHQVGTTYDGSHVAFSSDGTLFVLCNKTTVTIQNSSSGAVVAEFHVTGPISAQHCCFSPDGRLVAAAVDSTAYVWDITSSAPQPIDTFNGHTSGITTLAFSSSSSLISKSTDQLIKFWQVGVQGPALTDPKAASLTSAPMKLNLQAKDGITITSDLDGVVKTWDISTGLYKASFQTPAADSYKRDSQLINGRLIFVWYADRRLNIWDAEKGELLLAAEGLHALEDLRISGDGSRVFCLGIGSLQACSLQTGEIVGEVEVEGSEYAGSLAVDGSRVWICYPDSGYLGWDFGIPGSSLVQSYNMPPCKLHPNGVILWDTGLSRIKDKETGKVVFQLPKIFGMPADVEWNDQYLVICFAPSDVLILDFSHVLL